ncbi:MAG: DUF4868 domain-containing protein [Burkholderiales bacterium]|nr:DUF4868 domain-containing protein [Burkholderiales bacterium]
MEFSNVEFGICANNNRESIVCRIPIDNSVKIVLKEMYTSFYESYQAIDGEVRNFEPSEKYGQLEKLTISIADEHLKNFQQLFNDNSIPVSSESLQSLSSGIRYYFAIFYADGNKHIGVKRPSQFKSLLKKRNFLMRLCDDTLESISDDVFKLDTDFDFIINANQIDILHPISFALLADIDDQILSAAEESTIKLKERISFIKFDEVIVEYVGKSKNAAKLIASIRIRDDLEKTSKEKLISKCKSLSVELTMHGDQVQPGEKHVMDFLQILDRREYDVDLTEDNPEIYIAASRRKVN